MIGEHEIRSASEVLSELPATLMQDVSVEKITISTYMDTVKISATVSFAEWSRMCQQRKVMPRSWAGGDGLYLSFQYDEHDGVTVELCTRLKFDRDRFVGSITYERIGELVRTGVMCDEEESVAESRRGAIRRMYPNRR